MFDWSKIAKVNFDDDRRKKLGIKTGKQMFAEAHQNMIKSENHKAWRAQVEPLLKSHLLDHMVNKKTIQVLSPITFHTEGLPGGESEEDDDFYQVKKSQNVGSFEITTQVIPVGTQLMFKSHDKALGQFIFRDQNSKEYSIYQYPTLNMFGKVQENPGFFGLLYNTNLRSLIEE